MSLFGSDREPLNEIARVIEEWIEKNGIENLDISVEEIMSAVAWGMKSISYLYQNEKKEK